nr:MAG TPA: hypothetical protein [Caudoviricetes sp.]
MSDNLRTHCFDLFWLKKYVILPCFLIHFQT